MSEKLMQEGDNKELPHLYNTNVLRMAKYEINQKNYMEKFNGRLH